MVISRRVEVMKGLLILLCLWLYQCVYVAVLELYGCPRRQYAMIFSRAFATGPSLALVLVHSPYILIRAT